MKKIKRLGSLTLLPKRKRYSTQIQAPSIKSHKNYSEKKKQASKDNTFATIKKQKKRQKQKQKERKKGASKVKAIFRLICGLQSKRSKTQVADRGLYQKQVPAEDCRE